MNVRAGSLGIALALAAACGGGSSSSGFGGNGGDDASTGGGDDAGSLGQDGGSFTPDGAFTSGDSGAQQPAIVYGHSPDTLYTLDPNTKAVTVVGAFQGCNNQVIDLALDKDSNMFVTTFTGVYKVDRATAKCTVVHEGGSYPNSLSFVPKGTVDPNAEALVGYFGASYVRIDTTTGAITTIGQLGGGYQSSGDIVSVIGGATYLTVNGNGCADCIVQVNPATGALVKSYGPLGHGSVFGIAFWAGTAFGFDDAGELFSIVFGASTVTTTPIAIPNMPANLQFWGAGSTTSAPPGPR